MHWKKKTYIQGLIYQFIMHIFCTFLPKFFKYFSLFALFKILFCPLSEKSHAWPYFLEKTLDMTVMNYKNWIQLVLEKRLLYQDSINNITVLIKMRYWIILKSFLTLTAWKNFVPVPWLRKKKCSLVSGFSE